MEPGVAYHSKNAFPITTQYQQPVEPGVGCRIAVGEWGVVVVVINELDELFLLALEIITCQRSTRGTKPIINGTKRAHANIQGRHPVW